MLDLKGLKNTIRFNELYLSALREQINLAEQQGNSKDFYDFKEIYKNIRQTNKHYKRLISKIKGV